MNNKGQGATEYLIILAVIIIIALIVVGVMGGIPSIGTGAKARSSASFWMTSEIGITEFAAGTASEILNVTLRNNLAETITLGDVVIGGGTMTCDNTKLSVGQSTSCSDANGAESCTASGEVFSFDVSVEYTNQAGSGYTFTGEGQKLVGKCAD